MTIEQISEDELRARIERLYERYPTLRGYVPPSTCCSGCKEKDVADEYGWKAARGWSEIETWRWLLGES